MTENQKLWLEELIEDYRTAAANETIWSQGSADPEEAQMHEDNADELNDFANLLATLFN